MKRWMIVGFAAGAALFGYPPVLVAATQAETVGGRLGARRGALREQSSGPELG